MFVLSRATGARNWPTEVRNGLSDVMSAGREKERITRRRQALEATAERVERDLHDDERAPAEGAGLIGFVEVARKPAEERWYASAGEVELATPNPEILQPADRHAFTNFSSCSMIRRQPHAGIAVVSSAARNPSARLDSLAEWRLHDWELE